MSNLFNFFTLWVGLFWGALSFGAPLHMKLDTQLTMNRIFSTASIYFAQPVRSFSFSLNSNLEITQTNGHILKKTTNNSVQTYTLQFNSPSTVVELNYEGVILDSPDPENNSGGLSEKGATLLGEAYWHPYWDQPFSFEVSVTAPEQWKVLTSGDLEKRNGTIWTYKSSVPVDAISLVAYNFVEYTTLSADGTTVQVWLRQTDKDLALRYLEKVPKFIEDYVHKIGPFPYKQYSVIENYWETGYAIPGFTLLGPAVLRLPFIFNSSLPHEVLHSWWGNSAYVDYEKGNWCEGLTTHMADHFMKIQEGKGPEYRRKTLQAYQDFVSLENDFPVRKFTSRIDQGTQAVGYGKTMMIFNMLEKWIGPQQFEEGLRKFYNTYKFKKTSFDEIQSTFEKLLEKKMENFFHPWLDLVGAPTLSIHKATVHENHLKLSLQQDSEYVLPVPVRVTFDDNTSQNELFVLRSSIETFEESYDKKIKEIWVDPEFDVFRKLFPEESPTALSKAFGEKSQVTISYPSGEKEKWSEWIAETQRLFQVPAVLIEDAAPIPNKGALVIIGSQNRHLESFKSLFGQKNLTFDSKKLSWATQNWDIKNSVAYMVDRQQELVVLGVWTSAEASPQIHSQKIKHYSSFSLAIFQDLKNQIKTEWSTMSSPLHMSF